MQLSRAVCIIKFMNTQVWQINKDNIDSALIYKAGQILKDGGLVAFPTETVYGLGGDALNKEASAKIYGAKGRPSDNPLIVHIASLKDLKKITSDVSKEASALATAFWPGPLTMIFKKTDLVPMETTGGLDTVAVRMPRDEVALALIQAAGGFVAAPSANTSGRPSPTKAIHVKEDLDGKIPLILDSGSAIIGLESTIVDMTGEVPTILRPGYITKEMMEQVVGKVEIDKGIVADNSHVKPKAPGMKYRHYAPKAAMTIVDGEKEAVIAKINELVDQAREKGQKVAVLAAEESVDRYQASVVKSLGSIDNELEIAANLYDALREFDHLEVDVIYSESFSTKQLGQAIMNRLKKAAGQRVIEV